MFSIFAAILSRLGFNGLSVYWKFFRDRGLSTRTVLGLSGFAALIWVPMLIWYLARGDLNLTPVYFLYLGLWAASVLCVRFSTVYLFKYQGLTVSEGFRYIFSMLVAFVMDVYFFGFQISPFLLVGGALLVIGSLFLHKDRQGEARIRSELNWSRLIAINLVVAVFSVLEFTFGKAGLALQESVLAHASFYNGIYVSCIFIWALSGVREAVQAGIVPWRHIVLLTLLQVVSAFLFTYALGILSVLFMTMVRIAGTSIFILFDHKYREFSLYHKKTWLALGLILIGFILSIYAQSV